MFPISLNFWVTIASDLNVTLCEIPVSVFLSILMTVLSGRNTVMCSTWLPVSQIFGSDYFI